MKFLFLLLFAINAQVYTIYNKDRYKPFKTTNIGYTTKHGYCNTYSPGNPVQNDGIYNRYSTLYSPFAMQPNKLYNEQIRSDYSALQTPKLTNPDGPHRIRVTDGEGNYYDTPNTNDNPDWVYRTDGNGTWWAYHDGRWYQWRFGRWWPNVDIWSSPLDNPPDLFAVPLQSMWFLLSLSLIYLFGKSIKI